MSQVDAAPIVELRDVDKRYGDGPLILDKVSLAAQRGDFITLIGPSGCGKSTILKLISGLTPVSAGRIVVDGMDPASAVERLAFVFQEPTLLPWLNVSRNVEVPLRLHGTGAAKRAKIVRETLELVRLGDRTDYYPRQLSGGQKMRVSIARALSVSPRILLLDEPFAALDEITRNHLNEELLAIRQQLAWTAFFVTHSVAEAVFLSNRILVMSANPGRMHDELPVDLPYPRTEETRESPEYQKLVGEASRILRSVELLKS
jgi:NitT/TauT family transport system ATP-binding protein